MKTLKTIITICIFLIAFTGFSQTKHENTSLNYSKTTVSNLKIEVKAKSLKDLERSFIIKDLDNIFSELDTEDDIEFKITCTKPSKLKMNSKEEISYKIVGNAKEKEAFLKMAERIYNSAKNYYIN